MFVELIPTGRILQTGVTVYELQVTPEAIPCVRAFVEVLARIDNPHQLKALLDHAKTRLSPARSKA